MALSNSTFTATGNAVNDIFGVFGELAKAKGAEAESQEYDLAAGLARQNKQFTETSTNIRTAQQDRTVFQALGAQEQGVASAGFEASGSALDLLRSSAQQGAITRAALNEQGQITEAGYEEQAQSYDLMSNAAKSAASADRLAAWGKGIGALLSASSAAFSLVPA